MHNAFDVFDDHDGIIHQQPDGQHHSKQRQGIDGVAAKRQYAKGAEQYHRHRQRRDQRRTDILQEQVHHHHHQRDRFDQGDHHILNGDFDEVSAVERIGHLITFRH